MEKSGGWVTGLLLLGFTAALAVLSDRIGARPSATDPVVAMVALMMAAGTVYWIAIRRLLRISVNRRALGLIFLVGLLLRLGWFFTEPMLEDDHYRYLWDGAVLANGFNPYRYPPAGFRETGTLRIPPRLARLAENGGEVIDRINHGRLRTIYPPVAQAAFAAAYLVRPWSLNAWRAVLAVFDLWTLVLLFRMLTQLRLPPAGLAIYWWNPLLVKEVYNSAHLDVVLLPFLLSAVMLAYRSRHRWAALVLGLAFGVKLWPVWLLPVLIRSAFRRPLRALQALLVFCATAAAMLLPYWLTGFDPDSGLVAYARYWEMNDALYMLVVRLADWGLQAFGSDLASAQAMARGAVVALLVGWTGWVNRRPPGRPAEMAHRCLLVTAALFLLSPTQFPWYFVWLLPFLTLAPNGVLLFYTVLLPIYYLRIYFEMRARVQWFDNGVVWLEHLPVLGGIVWMWLKSGPQRRSRAGSADRQT
jgi:hypothetical protein